MEGLVQLTEHWSSLLTNYDKTDLWRQPPAEGWSIGQVALHLIEQTTFFLEQARLCTTGAASVTEGEMKPSGKQLFANGGFPDIRIQSPAADPIATHETGAELAARIRQLGISALQLEAAVLKAPAAVKTLHPGLGYFNAREWMQFAAMHLRHHLRQKERLDHWLATLR